ncbi:MAG TPA: arylesterase [Steroidobacteraceae bacterium]|nr:arylesterase [Steroidobacteraceae bacterium]
MRSIRVLLFALWMTCNAASAATGERTLLVFGDSLSAAYGLRADQGWVAQLQQRLQSQGYGYRVVNASVSGETTSGGRNRLERALSQHKPRVVVLELGANDGLRGLPMKEMRDNLATMIDIIRRRGARVLLLGIRIPPNYGPQYTQAFGDVYKSLAAEKKVPLVPFLLDTIALDERFMQPDGLHPNAQGQPLVLANVWPALKPLLER